MLAIHSLIRGDGRISNSQIIVQLKDNGKTLKYSWYTDTADIQTSTNDDIWDGRNYTCTKIEKN
jgi:hypothetical protein